MELLSMSQAVAQEKNLDYDVVLEHAIHALEKAARNHYGRENDIRISIDRKTQAMTIARYREVIADDAEMENEHYQIRQSDARRENANVNVGEFLVDELPMVEFSRADAQTVKQSFNQGIREADRDRQFQEFEDREGEIVIGTVKREEYGNATVDIGGKAEAILRRDESLPRERLKMGDRVRAYIYRVSREARGPQIFLSRTHPQFMAQLFATEVPEIYEGVIEIKAVARDPGSRAKIAVFSNDSSLDPVGACVGMRGSRVQAVVNELSGEKVDIIPWSEDPATFVVNALAPAEVAKIVLDEDAGRLEVVVPDEQLSLAIGRRGQNVRLASMLTGWDIDILTEAEESERRAAETKERTGLFMQVLDVDDVIAHLLVAEGFTNVEEVAYIEQSELAEIEGFDENVAAELQQRAKTWLDKRDADRQATIKKLGIQDDLVNFEGLTFEMIEALGKAGVKSLDDFADLASDEFIEIIGEGKMRTGAANEMIMRARAHWFADEESETEATA